MKSHEIIMFVFVGVIVAMVIFMMWHTSREDKF